MDKQSLAAPAKPPKKIRSLTHGVPRHLPFIAFVAANGDLGVGYNGNRAAGRKPIWQVTTALAGLAILVIGQARAQAPANTQFGPSAAGQPGSRLSASPTTTPSQVPPAADPAVQPHRGGAIEEVIVTAQRRRENLQNVPIAVTAFSPRQLANSGVTNIQDLNAVAPGVSVSVSAGNSNPYIRGVGSQAFGPGIEPPIAIYVDGVYYASAFGTPFDFDNVAQVEVLRGPQGTLFGRNATGGLIQITTRTPTQERHVDADFSYGNYNTVKGNLYATGGVAANLAADVAVSIGHQGDGYGTNLYNGRPVNQTDVDLGLRSKWLWTPQEGTRLTTIFDYDQQRGSDNSLRPQPGKLLPPFLTNYGGSPWDTDSNVQPLLYHKGGGVSGRLEQDIGFAELVDTLAYRQGSTLIDLDLDLTPLNFESTSITEQEHQLTNELQIQSKKDSRITYTAGIYAFDNHGSDKPSNLFFSPNPRLNPAFPLGGIGVIGTEVTRSLAGYAQASAEILKATTFTAGIRYTYEERRISSNETGFVGPVVLPLLSNVTASKAYFDTTYRFALDHRFSPQTLAYISMNTGFKSGGFNVAGPLDPAYQPEKLTAYAVGLKNNFFGRRLRFNLEAFYYDYTNLQVDIVEHNAPGITNGGSAHDYGLDMDGVAQITDAFRVTGGLELLHARFSSYLNNAAISSSSGATPPTFGSASGNAPPYSPRVVFSLSGDYTFNLLGGDLDANATYAYNSGYYLEVDNVIHQGPFSLLNASVRWDSPDSRYTVAVFGKNLTDSAVIQNGLSQSFGAHYTNYLPPRTYGFEVGYHF